MAPPHMHGRKTVKPKKSQNIMQQQQAAGQGEPDASFAMPPIPYTGDDIGQILDHSQVPNGPGFAPH